MFVKTVVEAPAFDRDRFPVASAGSDEIHVVTDQDIVAQLEARLGRTYARQRLGIERDHEQRAFGGGGINFFHIENWYLSPSLIRNGLRAMGLYGRARRNAADVQVRQNTVRSDRLPKEFDGFTILHLSDMHVDISESAMRNLSKILPDLKYDICVLTGDYRGKTFGPFDAALKGLAEVRSRLTGPVYAVLGNHDTICMVPEWKAWEFECFLTKRSSLSDKANAYTLPGSTTLIFTASTTSRKRLPTFPMRAFSILLSHTPEIYRQAAHAGFDLLLGGHTHGGQICLPGAIPITLDSVLPRRMGSGSWQYHDMIGYTSVGVGSSILPVRLNCFPEITLHRLERA